MVRAEEAILGGNLGLAEDLLWYALQEADKFGPTSQEMMTTGDRLAEVLMDQQKFTDAEEVLLRLAEMKNQVLGPADESTGKTMLKLAAAYYAQQKFRQAEPFALSALRVFETCFGKEHGETVRATTNLAYINHAQGKAAEAREYYRRSIATQSKLLGENHEDVVSLKSLCESLGEELAAAPAQQVGAAALPADDHISRMLDKGFAALDNETDEQLPGH